ncbi:MAG TPA: hypothetical protein VJX70_00995 [Candidatus Acidoferrum sp.]|nr:hypothetical protein [Candidatus Acidoferrum sp.]
MNRAQTESYVMDTSAAELALQELQERIEASGLEATYAGLVCDLCVEQVSLEKAFGEVHQKAIEHMVGLLDAKILEDELALQACLDKIAQESERLAWSALERGTEALREGIAILEGTAFMPDGGYVN